MRAKTVASSLFLLVALVGGCGPAPLVVADPERPATSPASESGQVLPVATEDAATVPMVPGPESTVSKETSEPFTEEEADVTTAWPLFRDEEHGFQVAYPPGWSFMDLPVHDPGTDGPPTVIRRFVIFYPLGWEERLRPGGPPDPNVASYPALSIEVCVGTMEAYRREFMELGGSEVIEINGLPATYERDTYDDYNLSRYIFQHPANDQLIIGLTDAVSGFSVRAEESADVVPLIPMMAGTFAFID